MKYCRERWETGIKYTERWKQSKLIWSKLCGSKTCCLHNIAKSMTKSDDKIVWQQTVWVSLFTKINGWLCVSQRKAMHGGIDVMDREDGIRPGSHCVHCSGATFDIFEIFSLPENLRSSMKIHRKSFWSEFRLRLWSCLRRLSGLGKRGRLEKWGN